jgi:hypothetical protein
MKRLTAAMGIVLAVSGIVRAQGTPQDKIYSRQKAFRIPFQIPDPAEQKNLAEVQLFVARNGGTWEKYTGAPPDVPADRRNFTFRTDQDGEFWFAVRTMDKKGGLNPADDGDLQIGLRVVVDSEVPKIELRPIARSGREVGVEWEVTDRTLDLDTLKMEYRVDGQDNWQSVPGLLPKFIGQAIWTPDTTGRVTVRCQVQDRAQNFGIQTIELDSGAAAVRQDNTRPFDTIGPRSSTRTPRAESTTESNSGMKPFNTQPDVPINRPSLPTKTTPAATKRSTTSIPTIDPSADNAGNEPADSGFEESAAPTNPTSTRSPLPKTGTFNSGPRSAPPAAAAQKPTNRQVVNDSEISLDYQIEDEGPSGVSVIELWVTTDMARTWRRVGEDSDRQSPFTINLAGDGVYGLTMVAKSGVGLGDRPPVAGDQPQMWVEVDKALPTIQLDQPEIGRGPQAGSVIITWLADDANLGDRCVSLFYAEGTTNNWKPIATGIDNTGRYVWKMGQGTPYRFRVAIEVADMAGNREMAESAEVTIDMSKPKPKISGVNTGKSYR